MGQSRVLKAAIKDLDALTENELKGSVRNLSRHIKDDLKEIKKIQKLMGELVMIKAAVEVKLRGIKKAKNEAKKIKKNA